MARSKHPNKHIEDAICYAESQDWTYVAVGKAAHAWGKLHCPHNDKSCRTGQFCQVSVWSTPRSPENHARQIIRWVDHCIYKQGGEDNE